MEAKLLMACGYPRDAEQLSFNAKLQRFEMLTRQNQMTKTNALHITLNFSNRDLLDDKLLQQIALDYMDRIGFGAQPFLVYRHYDAAHPHIHIATVNIEHGGQRIETHNIGKNQSEKARKEMEIWYGLIKAEEQKKEQSYMLRPANLKRVEYGKTETKSTISAIVREVTGSYKFSSLPELNAVLRQFNVMASRGPSDSRMYEKGGLVYMIIDEKGEPLGIPIKASSIYGSPTLKNLELKYKTNEAERKPFGLRIRHLLDKTLSTVSNKEELEDKLRDQGIRILMRENVQGNIYGLTFIDNGTRCVFNGSDLGKAYSAKAFLERLEQTGYKPEPKEAILQSETPHTADKKEPVQQVQTQAEPKENARAYPAQEQSVIEVLWDIAFPERYEENAPNPFRRKRRNLGLE